jgi:hypothetical protein
MGIQHRLTRTRWYVPAAALLALAGACSHSTEDNKRRAVLAPVELHNTERELYEKLRFYDGAGNLLPSDENIAGVLVPRGLTHTFTLEREWYFDAQLPRIKLEQYFRAHLDGGQVSYPGPDTFELLKGIPKDTKDALPVLVRVYPQPGRGDAARVYIRQAAPAPARWPSEGEVREQMALRRSHQE